MQEHSLPLGLKQNALAIQEHLQHVRARLVDTAASADFEPLFQCLAVECSRTITSIQRLDLNAWPRSDRSFYCWLLCGELTGPYNRISTELEKLSPSGRTERYLRGKSLGVRSNFQHAWRSANQVHTYNNLLQQAEQQAEQQAQRLVKRAVEEAPPEYESPAAALQSVGPPLPPYSMPSISSLYDICVQALLLLKQTRFYELLTPSCDALELWGMGLFEPELLALDNLFLPGTKRPELLFDMITRFLVHIAVDAAELLSQDESTDQFEQMRCKIMAMIGREPLLGYVREKWYDFADEPSSVLGSDVNKDDDPAADKDNIDTSYLAQDIMDTIVCLDDLLPSIRSRRQAHLLQIDRDIGHK